MELCRVFESVAQVKITSPFGYRIHPITNKRTMHRGVDIIPATPMPNLPHVIAHSAGRVTAAGYDNSAGNFVVMQCGEGITTRYFHMLSRIVSVGQTIPKGGRIGVMGSTGASTGAHLHFQVEDEGKPIDPEPFLYKEIETMGITNEQFRKLYAAAKAEEAAGVASTDPESVAAREWCIKCGIFKGRPEGMQWKGQLTRQELALALYRAHKVLAGVSKLNV